MTSIALLDVAYAEDASAVACVLMDAWESDTARAQHARRIAQPPAPYQPGEFYRRELPLLLAMLEALEERPRLVVIDGYVWLGEDTPGLGARLFAALQGAVPVVGVAKSRFQDDTWSHPVSRGTSQRPLYVTAAGVELSEASEWIARMHGAYRIPTLLQQVDALARATLAGR